MLRSRPMGAEPWIVRGPWRESIAEALSETRARVFREGSYTPVPGRSFATLDDMDAFFMREPDVDDDGEVCLDGVEGTASILDIRGLCDAVEPGGASPTSDAQLMAVFGTLTPSPEAVTIGGCGPLLDELDRGAARYVVAYENGAPSELVFIGYSWD